MLCTVQTGRIEYDKTCMYNPKARVCVLDRVVLLYHVFIWLCEEEQHPQGNAPPYIIICCFVCDNGVIYRQWGNIWFRVVVGHSSSCVMASCIPFSCLGKLASAQCPDLARLCVYQVRSGSVTTGLCSRVRGSRAARGAQTWLSACSTGATCVYVTVGVPHACLSYLVSCS